MPASSTGGLRLRWWCLAILVLVVVLTNCQTGVVLERLCLTGRMALGALQAGAQPVGLMATLSLM